MLLTSFEVIVSVSADEAPNENLAVAEAVRYLSAASPHFAQDADLWRVDTYDGPNEGWSDDETLDWGIGLTFDTIIGEGDSVDSLAAELEAATYVESVERIPN